MSRIRTLIRRLRRDTAGITIVEFAFVAPVLMLMLVGTIDLGYAAFVRSVVEGQLDSLTRRLTVQNASYTSLEAAMRIQVQKVAGNSTVNFTKQTLKRFNGATTPEKLIQDNGAAGYHIGEGDCFEDVNNNQIRDSTSTIDDTVGGADDIILYQANVTYPRILPLDKFIPGIGANVVINAKSMAKRQPYEGQTAPPIYCG